MQRHDRQIHAEPLDLARVKREASFAQILDRYGMKALGEGAQRMALCPFHADTTPSCSIHLERNVFHCFGCNAKGSVLDFVARRENVSIRDAAARVEEICGLRSDAPAVHTRRTSQGSQSRHPAQPLRPLKFQLKLDPTHPYLAGRCVSPELAAQLGLGYCSCGTTMQGWICIPIHDELGVLVAYADDIPRGVPKYLLPRGFEKRRVLFGLHRVAGSEHLILVEGYWSVFPLAYRRSLSWGAYSPLSKRRFLTGIARIGQAAGAEKLGCTLVVVPPGKKAWPYHLQHANEEMFVILEGSGTLRYEGERYPLRAGDVIATPIRTAHQIINTSNAELRYLAISTMLEPDIAEYPDSAKRLMLAGSPPGRGPYPLYVLTPNDATADYWAGEE